MQGIDLSEALLITILSIFVVFIVLVIISLLIGILKNFRGKERNEPMDSNSIIETEEVVEQSRQDINGNGDQELVAVIAAVIAESMGLDAPDIKIEKIRRIDNSIWNNAARLEQMN